MQGVGDRSPWEVARKRGHAQPHLQPGPLEELEPGGARHRECLLFPLHRPGGQASWAPLRVMLARSGEPTPGLASRAFRQGRGRIPAAPAAQDTGLRPVWAGPLPGQGRGPGVAGPLSLSPPLLPGGSRTPAPSQTCGPEPSGRRGWPHMCTISLQPRGSPPPPGGGPRGAHHSHQHLQGVTLHQEAGPGGASLLAHTPRTVCSLSSFSHEPWKRWTFCESRPCGLRAGGRLASSRVPGKFWALLCVGANGLFAEMSLFQSRWASPPTGGRR